MSKLKYFTVISCVLFLTNKSHGQDPSFAQFFASPLNVNPALTGNINGDWRFITNFRDEWFGPASPYVTGTVSYDQKILQENIPNVPEKNFAGIGGMLMYDNAMNGIQKSVYGSVNLSYNLKLAETEYVTQRLGIGFGATYVRRSIDFSRVNFSEQFTGTAFDTNLPTGESGITNMKPYFSANVGLVYTYKTVNSNFDFGVAAFHVNKPRQTFTADERQIVPIRKVVHANYETYLNERVVLNANAIYQQQSSADYLSTGAALGYFLGDENGSMLHAGLWYWSKNAVIPYLGLTFKNYQFGFSYDITTSKLNQAVRRPGTWEISFVIRGKQRASGIIPCPWK